MGKEKTNLEDYQLIQRFFDFELTDEELEKFNERMETDTDFVSRMHIYQQMSAHADNTIKSAVTTKKESSSNKIVSLRSGRFIRWAVAAILLLAIGSWVIFQFYLHPTTPEQLATNYWNETEATTFSNTRSDVPITSEEALLTQASDAFVVNNFQETITILSAISIPDTLYAKAALLKGQAFFHLSRYDEAADQFQKVIDSEKNEYNDIAYWYQALTFLKLGQLENAKNNLEYIVTQGYTLESNASTLLDEL